MCVCLSQFCFSDTASTSCLCFRSERGRNSPDNHAGCVPQANMTGFCEVRLIEVFEFEIPREEHGAIGVSMSLFDSHKRFEGSNCSRNGFFSQEQDHKLSNTELTFQTRIKNKRHSLSNFSRSTSKEIAAGITCNCIPRNFILLRTCQC